MRGPHLRSPVRQRPHKVRRSHAQREPRRIHDDHCVHAHLERLRKRVGRHVERVGVNVNEMGVAPKRSTASAVLTNVHVGTATRWPGPTPISASTISSAVVHEEHVTTCSAPRYATSSCSNAAATLPVVSQPDSSTSVTARISEAVISGLENAWGAVLSCGVRRCHPSSVRRRFHRVSPPDLASTCADATLLAR